MTPILNQIFPRAVEELAGVFDVFFLMLSAHFHNFSNIFVIYRLICFISSNLCRLFRFPIFMERSGYLLDICCAWRRMKRYIVKLRGSKFAFVRQDDAVLWTKSRQLASTLKKVLGGFGLRSFKSISDESDQLNDLTKNGFHIACFLEFLVWKP